MLELLCLVAMLVAVLAVLERNHHRTAQLSRTPFALDLELAGDADLRRHRAEQWSLARSQDADGARARHEVSTVALPQRRAHQARARWI
ncbi:MAG: hypothetical protein IPI32_09540 [Austwickia sp.]|jgi:hypothetical protein|nr:hypothetical protein [Austwickia sp.]MBK8436259.1 hypothetical protein [Austwickia sp.]MBK9101936.1 hypothetical protein [Austwickia sp.]